MGDKTQLLAMAFATRYPAYKVLIAVFIATLLNHALAVVVGHYLTVFVPLEIISLIASISFIIFGLWTLRGDRLEGEADRKSRFGPIVTVAIAFFLAEMGDKTQLATISLAIEYRDMAYVLMGTTLGMVVADAIGIGVGVVMQKNMPENVIKWIAASVFAAFGFIGIYQVLHIQAGLFCTLVILLALALCTALAAYLIIRRKKPAGD
jgi:putative Ca2+/H+ antiporter (TMEM165/GDT1 family)